MTRGMFWVRLALLIALSVGAAPALPIPQEGTAGICQRAAQRAAQATGVPLRVLLAVALTETGRTRDGTFAPWPWTLNIAGQGRFFDSRAAALDHARAALARGQTSVDTGCFQVNYRWHRDGFASLEAMLDPERNARYAAEFLAALHAESGDWATAVGHYHSRTPRHANRYRKVFRRNLAALEESGAAALPAERAPPRESRFPALQAGAPPGRLGSLVPPNAGAQPLIARGAARSLWSN